MTNLPLSEIVRHKPKDCACLLCVGIEKRGPDYDEAMPEQERRDAARQFEHDERLQVFGDD